MNKLLSKLIRYILYHESLFSSLTIDEEWISGIRLQENNFLSSCSGMSMSLTELRKRLVKVRVSWFGHLDHGTKNTCIDTVYMS